MKPSSHVRALAALLATTAGLSASAPAVVRAESDCVDCHATARSPEHRVPALASTLAHDTHARARVGCRDCHGGATGSSVRAHAPSAGFVAIPDPAACLRCHGDTPEAQRWGTSAHARSRLGGGRGPGCADCHGAHGAISPEDERSPASQENVPATCGRCHDDPDRVGRELARVRPLARWSASIHGRVFATGEQPGGRRAPACSDCHDPHAAAGGDAAARACARCHEPIAAAFRDGPHASVFERHGFLDCIECHGAHDVLPADAALVNAGAEAACRRCHGEGQDVWARVRAIGAALERSDEARRRIANAGGELRQEADDDIRALVAAVHRLDAEVVAERAEALERFAARAPAEAAPAAPATTAGCATARARSRAAWPLAAFGLSIAMLAVRRRR